jgi:hypothetical protein
MSTDRRPYFINGEFPLEWPTGHEPEWRLAYRNVDDVHTESIIRGDLREVERCVAEIRKRKWNRNDMTIIVTWTGNFRRF